MKSLGLVRYALAMGAASVLLVGCGALRPPIGAPGTVAQRQTFAIVAHAAHGKSWMLPDAKGQDLLYVSDLRKKASRVYVFSYPSGKLLGTLTGFSAAYGECVDKAGDVWITDFGASQILEYAHAGTAPISVLGDPDGFPVGCAVDGTTGNLAVTNWTNQSYGNGNVVVYNNAEGIPSAYTDPPILNLLACAYDDKGNLFVDGQNSESVLAELPRGGSSLVNISLNRGLVLPGYLQWDGKTLAIGDEGGRSGRSLIYQVRIEPRHRGIVVGRTRLRGSRQVIQFWKEGNRVVGADCLKQDIGFWKYPSGGLATKKIGRRRFKCLVGVTISRAPR